MYCNVLQCIVMYCNGMYCIVLYCIVLYGMVWYCIVCMYTYSSLMYIDWESGHEAAIPAASGIKVKRTLASAFVLGRPGIGSCWLKCHQQ